MRWLLLLIFFPLNLFATTVGSGTANTEERPISDFNKIELEGSGTLTITQSTRPSLTIKADDNILGELSTSVDNQILIIKPTTQIRPKTPIEYSVSLKEIQAIEIQGAADIKSAGVLKVDELVLEIEGAAKADLAIAGKVLEVDIDGAGQVTVTGKVESSEVEIDGAGKYHAMNLKTSKTTLEINGAGKAQVFATDELEVEVNGAGSVTYKGNPKVTQRVRGVGSVTKA